MNTTSKIETKAASAMARLVAGLPQPTLTKALLGFLAAIGLLLLSSIVAAGGESARITSEYREVLRSGNAERLREALEHGFPVHARDAEGNTPLMLAAVYADVSCLKVLLAAGAEVNVTNQAGATPLMRAAHDGEKVRLLLDRNATVNARSALGNTALMLAARPWNSDRAVALLLARGADAKATNFSGATALMAAVAGGNERSVRLLLTHGAAVNAQPMPDMAGFLFGGFRSPLMWAAFRGDLAMMELLLAAGADVNGQGLYGTALGQATWAEQTAAARFLIERGARVNQMSQADGYTALHWAASSERNDTTLVKLLLKHGADPNLGGAEAVDAFMGVPQTPLMLARRRGETPILAALTAAGATNETPDRIQDKKPPVRQLPQQLDAAPLRAAIGRALAPLQESSIRSKQEFLRHASQQDCTSCHQQFLPMAAIGLAKQRQVPIDLTAEAELVRISAAGDLKNSEVDWQALFHPDPAHSKGYALFGFAGEDLPATEITDSWVHHLSVLQGEDGRWFNNLPRPPMMTSDVSATALAIHALQRYPLPGRRAEFAQRVDRARHWLRGVKGENNEECVFQILGLAWAGERASNLQPLAKSLLAHQRPDGGWTQLLTGKSDAYATGQAVYALRVGAGIDRSHGAIERARQFLLRSQLDDGTWHVRRRAFPFQPTMKSGFPHGRDSWISAAATSWAVLALSLDAGTELASRTR